VSLRLNEPRRRLALLMIPACLALPACGGGSEAPPDTKVVVPTETATPEAAATSQFETVEGYMLSADIERVVLLTQEGIRTYFVQPGRGEQIGIDHLASHAGLTDIAFLVEFERLNRKRWIRNAREIAPPFPYVDPGTGQAP